MTVSTPLKSTPRVTPNSPSDSATLFRFLPLPFFSSASGGPCGSWASDRLGSSVAMR